MRGKFYGLLLLSAIVLAWVACSHERTNSDTDSTDTLEVADSLESDSAFFFQDEDEGLIMKEQLSEVFSDFIFAFTHNNRFQAERIRFPLPVTEMDGTTRTIRSGKQFRSEFILPGNDYYTLLLGDLDQINVLQNDSALQQISLQSIDLTTQAMTVYAFERNEGRWYLSNRTHSGFTPHVGDFLSFYERFATDSLFQQESVARHLKFAMDDTGEEEEEMEGTIDRDQWPVFRPEMPGMTFVNIDFGQSYPNPHFIYMLQCGISNGMLDIFTFHRDGNRWQLVSYEN